MKVFYLCAAILVFSIVSIAQEYKRNNVWTIGYWPMVKFNFNNGFLIDTFQQPTATRLSSCISDTNGNLLFYCNGYGLGDANGNLIENGDSINSPYGHILYAYYGGGGIFDQTSIILPKKGNTYYVFSTGMSDSAANNYLNFIKTEFDILNYSVVDMDSNNGKGKVVLKNKVLREQEHYVDCALHAVRHANGKDWWLIKADCENDRFQEFIVREDTILGPYYQYVPGNNKGDFCTWQSEIIFTEDGTKMASTMYGKIDSIGSNLFYDFNRVDLYDFDRCDGKLTYKQYYRVPLDTSTYPNNDIKRGICFSPDGKLLYMSNSYSIHQIDLLDTAINNSIFIHGPDTTLADFVWYSSMGLAPDGKIYVGSFGAHSLSYIDKPNIPGLGCDFKAKGLTQSYTYLMSPPNMPNYGLGADSALLVGCWPVQTNSVSEESEVWSVYPNPTNFTLYIQNAKSKQKVFYNAIGQPIFTTQKEEIDVSNLCKGVYFLYCEGTAKKVIVE